MKGALQSALVVCKISSDVGKGSAYVGGLLVVVRHFLLAKNVLVAALQIKTKEYMRLILISVYQRSTVHTPSFTAQFSIFLKVDTDAISYRRPRPKGGIERSPRNSTTLYVY